MRHLAVPHDWLTHRLTGNRVTDRSDASGTGYFSADTMRWRTDILDEVIGTRDWAPMLPQVLAPDAAAGTLTADAGAELGLDDDVIVSAGGGDQHLAAQESACAPATSPTASAPLWRRVRDYSGCRERHQRRDRRRREYSRRLPATGLHPQRDQGHRHHRTAPRRRSRRTRLALAAPLSNRIDRCWPPTSTVSARRVFPTRTDCWRESPRRRRASSWLSQRSRVSSSVCCAASTLSQPRASP